MKLKTNQFKRAILAKEKQIGLWVALANNVSAEVVAGAGFDWVLIDMEHSPNDVPLVLQQLQVFAGSDSSALVRVDNNDAVLVKKLLDIGAQGLLFPMIQSVEEAKTAVAATRYPPLGIRGVAGSTRATKYGRISDYPAQAESEIAVVVQLETAAAVANAVEIAKVGGVSGVLFGPADIAADIGLIGQPLHEKVWDMIMPAAEKLMNAGVPVGTLVLDAQFAVDLLKRGFTFVACGADSALLAKASDTLLRDVRDGIV